MMNYAVDNYKLRILKMRYLLILLVFLISACQTNSGTKVIEKRELNNHLLIFGGGYSATGNQVSLEKNVFYMDAILKSKTISSKYILFADGSKGERSLQYREEGGFPDKFQELIISCIGSTKAIKNYYRPHLVEAQGPLKRVEIDKFFNENCAKLGTKDRLLLYYTGHGGKGDKGDEQNTGLYLWHDGIYRVKDFANKLQTISKDVPIVCVMVQCYSGGFQNIIFKDGDASKGLTENNICGFYSTVFDRVAAGCTPDINEENYQEYSSWFWAALSGEKRNGDKIIKPDYDGNGFTSFDEAHAFTLINLWSIDIPTKTSELVLRQYKPKTIGETLAVGPNSTLEELVKVARPADRAALTALSEITKIPSNSKIADINKVLMSINTEMENLKKQKKEKDDELAKLAPKVAAKIRYHYPELANPFHPQTNNILVNEKENLKKILEPLQEFKDYEKSYSQSEALRIKLEATSKDVTRYFRMLRVMENIIYEPYFMRDAPKNVKEKYLKILAAEQGTF